MTDDLKRTDLQEKLKLKDRENFTANYLTPAIEAGFLELSFPGVPNHPQQTYRLTLKGQELKNTLDKI